MKKVLKLIITSMLALSFVFAVCACDNGDSKTNETGVRYKKIDGVYTVYDYVAEEGVTELDLGAQLGENVTDVRIKKGAFSGNSTLTKIIVPSKVTKIDAGAFEKMSALVTLELPFVGESANSDAFYAESQKADGKAVDAKRTIAHVFGTEEYDAGTPVTIYYNASSSTVCYAPITFREVIVNSSENYSIPMYAFNGAVNLTKVVLSGNVDAIGEFAFAGCKEITEIELPATVLTVYKSAFENCSKLNKLIVKADKITVKDNAFKGTKLARTALDGKVDNLDQDAIFGKIED